VILVQKSKTKKHLKSAKKHNYNPLIFPKIDDEPSALTKQHICQWIVDAWANVSVSRII